MVKIRHIEPYLERMKKVKKISILAFILIILCSTSVLAETKSIVVLPMKIHSAQDYSFLQSGIMDMLSSRLAWKDHFTVVEKSKTLEEVKKVGEITDADGAAKVGKELGADYAVFGSLTVLGQSVSIDAKILDVAAKNVVDSAFTQAKSLDEVIPKIDEFARSINTKVLGRAEPQAIQAQKPAEAAPKPQKEAPSPLLAPAYLQSPTEKIRISRLNPNFLLEQDEGQQMVFQSRIMPFEVKGLDIGDVDGDKQNELVAITDKNIIVLRKTEEGLVEVTRYNAPYAERLLTVDVGDMDKDGKVEIYVSRERGENGDTNSAVFELINGRLTPVVEGLKWYFRIVNIPDEGPVLFGQFKSGETAFQTSKVYRLSKRGNEILQGQEMSLPKGTNVFNFALAKFKGGVKRVVRINSSEYLQVLSMSGDILWESDNYYGGTINYLKKKDANPYTTEVDDRYYIPARIIVEDLDKDGETDIIANRNKSTTFRLTERYRIFSSGEIVCLSWKAIGLGENWVTQKIPGYVADYSLKDLDNDGKADLVCAVVRLDPAGVKEGTTTIISFGLAPRERKTE